MKGECKKCGRVADIYQGDICRKCLKMIKKFSPEVINTFRGSPPYAPVLDYCESPETKEAIKKIIGA